MNTRLFRVLVQNLDNCPLSGTLFALAIVFCACDILATLSSFNIGLNGTTHQCVTHLE